MPRGKNSTSSSSKSSRKNQQQYHYPYYQTGTSASSPTAVGTRVSPSSIHISGPTTTPYAAHTAVSSATLTAAASMSRAPSRRRRDTVLSERIIEHEVKVPKRVVREDIVEKVIVVPEKVVREEVVEERVAVREKIIEVAKPIIQEKIVEVPEVEYVEKIVEVREKVVQEKIREVPRIEYQERIVEVPKIVVQERVVEVPEYEYREVPVEKVVEVPEVREQVVVKEVPVPQYIDKPFPEYVTVEVPQEIAHNVPVPVEAVTTFAYKLPKLQPKYNAVDLTLYVPRFVEVPVPAEFMEEAHRVQAEHFASQVNVLAQQRAASLCEVENLAGAIKGTDFGGIFSKGNHNEMLAASWAAGKMEVKNSGNAYVTTNTRKYSGSHQKINKPLSNQVIPVGGAVQRR